MERSAIVADWPATGSGPQNFPTVALAGAARLPADPAGTERARIYHRRADTGFQARQRLRLHRAKSAVVREWGAGPGQPPTGLACRVRTAAADHARHCRAPQRFA